MIEQQVYQPLGIVASHRRSIKPGVQYNRFFKNPSGTAQLLKSNATVFDTLAAMDAKIKSTLNQTVAITRHLKNGTGGNIEKFLNNLWSFLYNHIQYEEDEQGKEILRSPNRLWYDRKGDCDCYALTVSSILTNANIKHSIRIVKINNKPYYQHVYVVVPKNQTLPGDTKNLTRSEYWVVDPVLDKFNIEPGE